MTAQTTLTKEAISLLSTTRPGAVRTANNMIRFSCCFLSPAFDSPLCESLYVELTQLETAVREVLEVV